METGPSLGGRLLPFAAGALAIGIFIFGTVSPLQFGVAVLYVVVVFLAATYDQRRVAHDGTIDKFLGDGLLAVFGAPVPSPRDATNAARCALDIQQSISSWNERCHRSGPSAIQVAVGIHYGDVVQGDIGNEKQLELAVFGDTVNVASRVEVYCRALGATVLVTGALVAALCSEGSDDLAARFADQGKHTLRGRAESIQLYGASKSAPPADG